MNKHRKAVYGKNVWVKEHIYDHLIAYKKEYQKKSISAVIAELLGVDP